MYLLDLFHEHAALSGTGAVRIQRDAQRIAKWTFLPPTASGRELLRMAALGCSGRPQARKILADLGAGMLVAPPGPLRLEVGVALHYPKDGLPGVKGSVVRGCGLDITPAGEVRYRGASTFTCLPRTTPILNAQGRSARSHFFLGYGTTPRVESRTVFDFSDPWHLNIRSASLFTPMAGLSNPVMVLEWIRHKGIRLSRYPKRKTLECLTEKLDTHLALDARQWLTLECCLASDWDGLAHWRQSVLLPVLDMVRVEFICMYGFNTTLEEDVARFRFLRTLPGAYVFTQRYRPFPGAPAPAEIDYFGPNPDPLLDELVRIIFPQNMKSMEIYYRWISRLYAEKYGRLHTNLVDTIFRYNNRDRKGRYLATLAGTRPMPM